MIVNCEIHETAKIWQPDLVNLYGCEIGQNCVIAAFVEIGRGVKIGDNCKVEAGAFIPEGVTIGNNVFVGPNVVFTNDRYPSVSGEWTLKYTVVGDSVSIGANATILSDLIIGEGTVIGAGSVVTKSTNPYSVVYGVPARPKLDKNPYLK